MLILRILPFLLLIFASTFSNAQQYDTVVVANPDYKGGIIKRVLFGAHYRMEWSTPVRVRILNIDSAYGGLTPKKQGGSRQTTNLRLEDSQGREYVIRSIDKTPKRVLPKEFQKTFAAELVQDQVSAEHPYASVVVPPLAEAAGVYHTNPSIVFVPYDTSFGQFTDDFKNMLAILEERPDDDMSGFPNFGNSSNVVGTEKMFENLYEDHDNEADQFLFARTRLFDMFIGDWGRHEDQWRWASFEKKKGKLYQPIPRDRDHVFFRFDGIFPYLASRKLGFRNWQNFGSGFPDITGLNLSATSIDRALLNEVTLDHWLYIAYELQKSLSDSVIENAVRKMPAEVFDLHGPEIIRKLKKRRDKLPLVVVHHYKNLAKDVDIVGSDDRENFYVNRISDWKTEVTMVKGKSITDTLYHRVFNGKETDEIRLYGFGSDDKFFITGHVRKGPKVRIIGGKGEDEFTDHSSVKGFKNRNLIYDTEEGSFMMPGPSTSINFSDKESDTINYFSREGYKYDVTAPVPTAEFNPDDGIFLGIGLVSRNYSFRKSPFSSRHKVMVNFASQTGAFSFNYTGDYRKAYRKWDLMNKIRLLGPRFVLNYFGFGNESVQIPDSSIQFYRVRANELNISSTLSKKFGKHFRIGFFPMYQYMEIQNTPGRFIAVEGALFPGIFQSNHYAGFGSRVEYSTLDDYWFPKKGRRWNLESAVNHNLQTPEIYSYIRSDLSFFYTPVSALTLTTRIGGGHNFGDFRFFQANTLGGTTNLRGFRRTRFYGRTSFFHNNEARLRLFNFKSYLFPGTFGTLAFFDYGRVWADGENSNKLHYGYGPGIWLQIYDLSLLSFTVGFSENDSFMNIQLGFLF